MTRRRVTAAAVWLAVLSGLMAIAAAWAPGAPPPEQALPLSAAIKVERCDGGQFEVEPGAAAEGLTLGYRGADPDDPHTACCGYDTAQVILIGDGESEAVMPFTFGRWGVIRRVGDRLWVFNQTFVVEAGAGELQVVYSPDRGQHWWSLAAIPTPSTTATGAQAPELRRFEIDAKGRGTLVLHLPEDDEDPSSGITPSLTERLEASLARLKAADFASRPEPAKRGDFTYRTHDFGRTWSNPRWSPPLVDQQR